MLAQDKASTAALVEKGEAVGSCVIIDTMLRQGGDFSLAHELVDHVLLDAKRSSDDFGIDEDGTLFDLHLGHFLFSNMALCRACQPELARSSC